VLQYHLYALALHRHLGLRVADYDYERDFGGVFYLFVRGMSERHPPGTGVYFDRPTLALLEELSDALGVGGSAA
jgi:exodeoxyribonuclease V beta subunit